MWDSPVESGVYFDKFFDWISELLEAWGDILTII